MVMPYAGVVDNGSNPVPSGWLLCDGSEQDASVYVTSKKSSSNNLWCHIQMVVVVRYYTF